MNKKAKIVFDSMSESMDSDARSDDSAQPLSFVSSMSEVCCPYPAHLYVWNLQNLGAVLVYLRSFHRRLEFAHTVARNHVGFTDLVLLHQYRLD